MTTSQAPLAARVERNLKAAQSSLGNSILAEDMLDALFMNARIDFDVYQAMFKKPTTARVPHVTLSRNDLIAAGTAVANDKVRRVAEVVNDLLTYSPQPGSQPGAELSSEDRINAVKDLLQELTGGMKPRR